MPHTQTALERFFELYENNANGGDIAALSAQFADGFLAAGPQGAKAVRASDFAPALLKRKQLFESLGCKSAALLSLQPTALDDRYTLARTQWRMNFEPPQGSPQEVLADSTFLVDTSGDAFKILVYLAHQDIAAILKERGIAPSPA